MIEPADWSSFLLGYQSDSAIATNEMSADECRFMKLLAMTRAIWTMSLPAQPAVAWGTEWVPDARYWRDHTKMVRWFARAAEI